MKWHKNIRTDILLSTAFLVSLAVLIVNDHYLKWHYGGFITGKLSDFAGLFFFTLFWCAFFPNRSKTVALFVAVFFVFWKSPLADSFFELWNLYVPFWQMGRVVDYTDCAALAVIPMALVYFNGKDAVSYKRALAAPVAVVAVLAMLGTSPVRYRHEVALRDMNSAPGQMTVEDVNVVIKGVLAAEGFGACDKCDIEKSHTSYDNRNDDLNFYINTNYDVSSGTVYVSFEQTMGKEADFNKAKDKLIEKISSALGQGFVVSWSAKYGQLQENFKHYGVLVLTGYTPSSEPATCVGAIKGNPEMVKAMQIVRAYVKEKGPKIKWSNEDWPVSCVRPEFKEESSCWHETHVSYRFGRVIGADENDYSMSVRTHYSVKENSVRFIINVSATDDYAVEAKTMALGIKDALGAALSETTEVQFVEDVLW